MFRSEDDTNISINHEVITAILPISFKSLITCEYNQNCFIIIPNAFRTMEFIACT